MEKQRGMQEKTIKALLRKKTDAWLASIKDEALRKVLRDETIVTGGCIASMLLGEPVNDVDVYFKTYSTAVRVAHYYVVEFEAKRQKRGGVALPITVQEMMDVRDKPRVRIVVRSAGVERSESEPQVVDPQVVKPQEPPPDYSYFEGEPDEATANYVSDVFNTGEAADKKEELDARKKIKGNYEPVFVSSNAISLSGDMQLIIRFYGEPEEIHGTYDFVHCMNYWVCSTGDLVLSVDALKALMSKTLVYRGSLYPVASIIRLRKFLTRDWKINAGQILKIVMQVSRLNLSDPKVLEDQLTGVDVAYFEQLMMRLRAHNPEAIDQAYLVEVIDELFG